MRHPMTLRRVVYEIPGMTSARVRQVEYRIADGTALTMKIYDAGDETESLRPTVIVVLGYSDVRAPEVLGCLISEMEAYVSWAQLLAASGMSAVTYVTGADPVEDTRAALEYVRTHASSLGIDASAVGVLAFSGNVPNALSVLIADPAAFRCAALLCGFMLDADGNTGVADGAAKWGFVTPAAGKTADDLPADVPLLVVRAGRDENPGVNASIDALASGALRRNVPLTLVNHATGPHAFDVLEDSTTSRAIVRQVLAFFQLYLNRD